jgi:hypothetical protein
LVPEMPPVQLQLQVQLVQLQLSPVQAVAAT